MQPADRPVALHNTWAACAASIARCIAATSPVLADGMFGAMRDAGANSETGWFRMNPADARGFVFIGPQGGDHHYQATPPAGVDPETVPVAPPVPRGGLKAEAEAFLRDARTLAGGAPIAINGGRIPIEATEEAVSVAAGVVGTLEAALALFEPGAVAGLLRETAIGFLRDLTQGGPAALEASTAGVVALRSRCGASGPIWALSQLRAQAGAPLVAQSPAPPLLYKLFDPFGPGSDPELAFRVATIDLAKAGQGESLASVLDALLARAEAARDRALDSRSVVAHGNALYEAAGDAWAAMRLAECLRDHVDPSLWPASLKPAYLDGYAASAEEIVIRATHALIVDCINLGSGSALVRHRALIAAEGPAKADELIESFWFYPRALRETLIAHSSGS